MHILYIIVEVGVKSFICKRPCVAVKTSARMSPGVVLNPISQIRKGYKLVGTRYLGDYPTRGSFPAAKLLS